VRNIENYGPKIGVLGVLDGKNFNPNTHTPRKSIPTETRYLAQKTVSTLLKMWSLKSGGQEILFKKLKIPGNPN